MTEAELTAHLAAVMKAVPESAVSARQALYSVMDQINRMQTELKDLRELERDVRKAVVRLTAPGAIIITTSASVSEPGTLVVPASPPRLALVRNAEAKAAFDAAVARGEGQP